MQEVYASWKAEQGDGPYASRGIANAAHQIVFPHRVAARRLREARRMNVSREVVQRFTQVLNEYIERLYGAGAKLDPAA